MTNPDGGFKDFLRPSIRIGGILSAAVAVCCAATVTSFLGGLWWPFELTTHFRTQYACILGLAAIVFVLLGRFKMAGVAVLCALPNLALIVPFYLTTPSPDAAGPRVRAVSMNLSTENHEYGKAVQCVRSYDPDFLAVSELNAAWSAHLCQQLTDYSHVVVRPRPDEFGIGLFSKIPIEEAAIVDLGKLGYPAIRASLMFGGHRLTVFAVHPPPPLFHDFRQERFRQMKELARRVQPARHVVVLGDLNCTPWSPMFRGLLIESWLLDGRTGFGILPTWPTSLPWLFIPVDHCLVSWDLLVTKLETGPNIGSDHYPLMVELQFPSVAAHNDGLVSTRGVYGHPSQSGE